MALIGPDNQNEVRLQILNADYESFENDPLRSFHNGHTGGSHEQLLFVRRLVLASLGGTLGASSTISLPNLPS